MEIHRLFLKNRDVSQLAGEHVGSGLNIREDTRDTDYIYKIITKGLDGNVHVYITG